MYRKEDNKMDNATRIIARMLINEYGEFVTRCDEEFKGADCYTCVDYNECQHKQMMKLDANRLACILLDEEDK
jgi:hypothetical protein